MAAISVILLVVAFLWVAAHGAYVLSTPVLILLFVYLVLLHSGQKL